MRYDATAGLVSAATAMERIRALLDEPVDALAEPFLLGTAAAVAQWADELEEAERLVRRGLARQRPSLLHPMDEALLNVRADIAAVRGRYRDLLVDPEVRQAGREGPQGSGQRARARPDRARRDGPHPGGVPARLPLRSPGRPGLLGTQPVPVRARRAAVGDR